MTPPASVVQFGPTEHYFWYRKQREVTRLLLRHWSAISAPSSTGGVTRYIDVGCGTGPDLALFHRLWSMHSPQSTGVSWQWLGIDASGRGLTRARLRLDEEGGQNVDLQLADFRRPLPYPTGAFRLVYLGSRGAYARSRGLPERVRATTGAGGIPAADHPEPAKPAATLAWSPARRQANRERLMQAPLATLDVDGESVDIFDHISIKPAGEWDALLRQIGVTPIDHGRGALCYGSKGFMDAEWFIGVRSLTEAFLDLWPRRLSRTWSDQTIVLARKDAN